MKSLIQYIYSVIGVFVLTMAFFVTHLPNSFAQDPIFTQYYHAPLLMNPALAGLSDESKVYLNYRNQWPGFPNAYTTYAVSYDQYFDNIQSGFGGFIVSDNAGDGILKTNKVAGIYSYRLKLAKNQFLKAGFEVGLVQRSLDFNKLVFLDQIDAEFGRITAGGSLIPTSEEIPEKNNKLYADVGMGLLYYNEYFYVGGSVKHLNTPSQSYLNVNNNLQAGLPMRFTAQVGAEYKLGEILGGRLPIFIAPSAILVKQGPFQQANMGSFIHFGAVGIGAWYRTNFGNADALIGAVMFKMGVLSVGYSFDYTTSALDLNGGTHEIGIGINFDDGVNESIYNDCFNIFR